DRAEMSLQFGDMLSQITQLPSSKQNNALMEQPTAYREPVKRRAALQAQASANTIELDGRVFTLPRTLHRYIDKTGNWSSLVGKLWQAPVDLGNQGVANFIFMGSGGSVPEHTHRGTEYTLVIDGEFSDGLSRYDTGDFIFMDGDKTHTPKSEGKEGCLVFSIVDQPLHFTSGLARLLNPFSHLFFR
ncbi:MAG: cupin domain-containing protein, partial [Pseudomonadota bacterium]|nr:cupin domain-containing protein [Pseudomonadota bacterium]